MPFPMTNCPAVATAAELPALTTPFSADAAMRQMQALAVTIAAS